MIGRELGGYRVVSRLGRGGMGVVYKAEDVQLTRAVAIKVLPPDLTADAIAKRRLVNEARAASHLDHRHICTIHHVGETDDGLLYVVMAYYEGETLAERIRRGPMAVDAATLFAMQIAQGLAAAHEAGVIHRDVKPANIIVTRKEELKILDFGFAKMAQIAALSTGRASGGTPAYMSPEQIRGDDADERADIWALGTVFYEMVTGQRPFKGETGQAVMYNILSTEPVPLRSLCPSVPDLVEAAVARALEKDPAKRFRYVADFQRAFDPSVGVTFVSPSSSRREPAPPPPPAILVLPFENLSPVAEDAYFADGLTDEIIADLSGATGIRVISRTSAMQLKNAQKDVRTIARELGVTHVLEGSVRKSAAAFRINAKLIDARADSALWAEKYSGGLEDVFDIQERISRKIVDALSLKLAPASSRRRFEDPEAYDKYLRAKQEMLRYSKDSLDRALEFLQSSERRAGENVLLTTAIGQVYWQYVNAGVSTDPACLSKARECGERVLAMDPESPHGYRLLGLVKVCQGELQESVRLLNKALEKDPNDVEALAWQVANYFVAGKNEAAAPIIERLLSLDPLTPMYQASPGLMAIAVGDFAGSVEPFATAVRMDPGNPGTRFYYGLSLVLTGREDEAARVLKLVEDQRDTYFGKLGRVLGLVIAGEHTEARAAIDDGLVASASADLQYCWQLAGVYAKVGDVERAQEMLERSVALGFSNYPLLAVHDPFLAPLRGRPRFEALMEQVKERWEAFEA